MRGLKREESRMLKGMQRGEKDVSSWKTAIKEGRGEGEAKERRAGEDGP